VPDGQVIDAAFEVADRIKGFSPHGVSMTKQVIWANLEASSLAAAIECENRSQLLLGMTGNLNEAITAFRENRKPVYTDT